MSKTLYQSEMIKMGPVKVTVKSDVLKSKFQGKPDYVILQIGGEERNYNAENPECASFFEGQKGRSFTIVAEGTREEAIITYVGESAPDPEPEQPPAGKAKPKSNRPPAQPPASRSKGTANRPPPPAQEESPPNGDDHPPAESRTAQRPPARPQESPEDKVRRAKEHANKVANVWIIAFKAGLYAREQIREQFTHEMSEAQFQSCVSTIAVQLEKDGFHHQMPTGILNLVPAAQKPAEAKAAA